MKKDLFKKRMLSLNKRIVVLLQDNHLSVMRGGTIVLDTDAKKGCVPSFGICDLTSNIALSCGCPPKNQQSDNNVTCPTKTS